MAKKANAEEKVEVAPQPVVEKTQQIKKQPAKPEWEIKDRLYTLKSNKQPLVFTIPSLITILPKVAGPCCSSTNGDLWFVAYFNSRW